MKALTLWPHLGPCRGDKKSDESLFQIPLSFKEVQLCNYLSLFWLECQKSQCLQTVTKYVYTATRETGTAFQVTAWNLFSTGRGKSAGCSLQKSYGVAWKYQSQYSGFHRKKTNHFPVFQRAQQIQNRESGVLS